MHATQPYDHQRVVAKYHHASKEHIQDAIDAAMEARREWESMPFEHRAAIFLKASDLIAGKYRPDVLATTMVGQAKTVLQAEIDAACEVIDFYRFAVAFAADLYRVSIIIIFTLNLPAHAYLTVLSTEQIAFKFCSLFFTNYVSDFRVSQNITLPMFGTAWSTEGWKDLSPA